MKGKNHGSEGEIKKEDDGDDGMNDEEVMGMG